MFLPFEEDDWALMPWAARRALDLAGRRMSLDAWRNLGERDRRRLAALGVEDRVDVEAVRAFDGVVEAPVFSPPAQAPVQITINAAEWSALSSVARHALHAYAIRGTLDRLETAQRALTSSGESQSTT